MTSNHELPDWDGPLYEAELGLIERAASGELLDLERGPAPTDDQPVIELKTMQAWGADRMIRVEVLRHLLVESQWPVHAKGVRLRGARITGVFDLESATLRCPLVLEDCYFDSVQPLVFDYATVSLLRLVRCRFAGLSANLLTVTKEMNLRSTVTGAVVLVDAKITGSLDLSGAALTSDASPALYADRLQVDGDLRLIDFEATGSGNGAPVQLIGAHISGALIAQDAVLTNNTGPGLFADRLQVDGSLLLRRFEATGGGSGEAAVRLVAAHIGGQINLSGAILTNNTGPALLADNLQVDGSLFFGDLDDNTFTATGSGDLGAVRLVGVRIGAGMRLNAVGIRNSSEEPGKLDLDGLVYAGLPRHPQPNEWLDILRQRTISL